MAAKSLGTSESLQHANSLMNRKWWLCFGLVTLLSLITDATDHESFQQVKHVSLFAPVMGMAHGCRDGSHMTLAGSSPHGLGMVGSPGHGLHLLGMMIPKQAQMNLHSSNCNCCFATPTSDQWLQTL